MEHRATVHDQLSCALKILRRSRIYIALVVLPIQAAGFHLLESAQRLLLKQSAGINPERQSDIHRALWISNSSLNS
jgi:hypothetical protein